MKTLDEPILMIEKLEPEELDRLSLPSFISHQSLQIEEIPSKEIKQKKPKKPKKPKEIKKIGRKRKGNDEESKGDNEEKKHGKFDKDNMITKIKVSSMTFIRDLVNQLLEHLGFDNNIRFIDIEYKQKKNINKKELNFLKNSNIEEILSKKDSDRYRRQAKEYDNKKNKSILEFVKKNEVMNDFLSQKFIKYFKELYLSDNKCMIFNGINMNLSDKVKTYKDLLIKNNIFDEKNENKKKMDSVIQTYFINHFRIRNNRC